MKNENGDKGFFLEVDVKYPKKLFNLHKDFPFLPGRKKVGKVEKLVAVLKIKKICCSQKSFKTSINHGLVLKKVRRVIQFNQSIVKEIH